MPRKRYVTPEALLRKVIEALEQDRMREAVLALLSEGPLRCSEALLRELEQPAVERSDQGDVPAASIVGAELLAYLRSIVRLGQSGFLGPGIHLRGPVQLFGVLAGHEVMGCADGEMRELVILQFQVVLQAVGLRNVRACDADDCPRLYVKTYRRTFCSRRCQKRVQMRKLRQQEREREAEQMRLRARRKRQGARA